MSLWRTVLRSTQARAALAVLLVYLGWQAYLVWMAPQKLAPELSQGEGKVHVLVTLPFEPDRFHVLAMQRFGRVSGTTENGIEVRGVPKAMLTRLARPYWVGRVEPFKGD